jgi:hypothetical protein
MTLIDGRISDRAMLKWTRGRRKRVADLSDGERPVKYFDFACRDTRERSGFVTFVQHDDSFVLSECIFRRLLYTHSD